jgi:hypothetical protein
LAGSSCWKDKVFFFEKKKQKTFDYLAAVSPGSARQICKSFLVLFFKKEPLAAQRGSNRGWHSGPKS